MGYDLDKRIKNLEQQSELDGVKRLGFFRTLFFCVLITWLLCFLIFARDRPASVQRVVDPITRIPIKNTVPDPALDDGSFDASHLIRRLQNGNANTAADNTYAPPSSDPAVPEEISEDKVAVWLARTNATVLERASWLKNLPGGFLLRAQYVAVVDTLLRWILTPEMLSALQNREETLSMLAEEPTRFGHTCVGALIGASFVVCGLWPFWLIGAGASFALIRFKLKHKDVDPILSVCDRGRSPFYSGIYGPLRRGKALSGTDMSCFGLACPPQIAQREAFKHPSVNLLKRGRALTETALELCQIILAHRDFPGFVEEERPVEEENAHPEELAGHHPLSFLVRPSELTLERNLKQILPALLEAHRALVKVYSSISSEVFHSRSDLRLGEPCAELAQISQGMSGLAKLLLSVLTPTRGYALAQLPTAHIVIAYLAVEAGKSLVFERIEQGFTKITPYPHLQARAVLQSIASYHKEFDGDSRLIIRQAILCSRRHGDFGRAFMPEDMPTSSHAIRDWLEVLMAHPDKREDSALMAELDAQTDEIRDNFQKNIVAFLRASRKQRESDPEGTATKNNKITKGIVHKSVVLMPRDQVIEIALSAFSEARLEHITRQRRLAKKFREALAVSARLPGFKRQISDQTKHEETIPGIISPEKRRTDERWLLVRMMLTRFNWLSTRVGDDAVPVDGIVFALVTPADATLGEKLKLPPVVPLRQRQFDRFLGEEWELHYYEKIYHPTEISTYVSKADFEAAVRGVAPDVNTSEATGPSSTTSDGH